MSTTNPALQPIDDILAQMERVIERCAREKTKLGYFAVLYRDVTARVRDGIAAGRFQDGPRMERHDVIFARRYLDALDAFWCGQQPTASWLLAFQAAPLWSPVILQHLMLGMNAHINLDLGIAAAQVAPGDQLPALKRDFDEITNLLDEMVHDMEERVERVSPWFRLIDRVGGRTNEQICGFGMGEARTLAWLTAERLAATPPDQVAQVIAMQDKLVSLLGLAVRSPIGIHVRLALLLILLRESRDVPHVMQVLHT